MCKKAAATIIFSSEGKKTEKEKNIKCSEEPRSWRLPDELKWASLFFVRFLVLVQKPEQQLLMGP